MSRPAAPLWAFRLACALLALAGAAWAAGGALAGYPLWSDEAYTLAAASSPIAETLRFFVLPDLHPPLHYLAFALWTGIFGPGEAALRSLSLLAALGSPAILWWRGRSLLSQPALLFATLWLCTHWIWIFYAQEVRQYGLMILFATWMSLEFPRLWHAPRPPSRAALAAFCAAAFCLAMLHYYGMVMAGVALLLLLWHWRGNLPAALAICATGGLCLVWTALHVPHIEFARTQTLSGWASAIGQPVELGLRLLFPQLHGMAAVRHDWPVPSVLLGLLVLGVLAFAVFSWRRGRAAVQSRAGAGVGESAEPMVLRGQLWLAGLTLAVLVVANGLAGVNPRVKGLTVLLPAASVLAGVAVAVLWRGRYWTQCVLALLLGGSALWINSVREADQERSHYWRRYPHFDRAGLEQLDLLTRQGGVRARAYCLHCGAARSTQAMLGVYWPPGQPPPVLGRMEDTRHLPTPFFVLSVDSRIRGMLEGRLQSLGLQFRALAHSPAQSADRTLLVWRRGEEPPAAP